MLIMTPDIAALCAAIDAVVPDLDEPTSSCAICGRGHGGMPCPHVEGSATVPEERLPELTAMLFDALEDLGCPIAATGATLKHVSGEWMIQCPDPLHTPAWWRYIHLPQRHGRMFETRSAAYLAIAEALANGPDAPR